MKNARVKKYLVLIILMIITIAIGSKAYAIELKKSELSKRYLEWLNLPEEERQNTIAPLPFNVRQSKITGIDRLKTLAKAANLPAKYDLRDYITVELKDQMSTGQCWAFSANSTVETTLAKQGEYLNFSERHVEYNTASNYIDGENEYALDRVIDSGGFYSTAYTYYTRGSGPVLEEDMPFINDTKEIKVFELPINNAIKKVDNVIYFPSILKQIDHEGNLTYLDSDYQEYTEDEVLEIRNKIKEHIMNYGAVNISIDAPSPFEIASNKKSYVSNHAVTIVGWDDNYSKENFEEQPFNDGAYIVLNSWGDFAGENGYYYISYEDSLVETEVVGVIGVSNIEYDNLYQYDLSEMWNSLEYKYLANVFQKKSDEVLTEITVGSISEQTCNIYLGDSSLSLENATKIASNVKLNPGYTTFKLDNEIELSKDYFSIIVEITSDKIDGLGVEDNHSPFGKAKSNQYESYISEDGTNWNDIYDENDMMNLSIKAYTKSKEKSIEITDIKGKAFENYGGKFTFSILTTYLEKGNEAQIKIFKDDADVTDKFAISGNEIRGNGAFVTIECNDSIEGGEYTLKVKLSNFDEIEETFIVNAIDENAVIVECNDENLFSNLCSMINCVSNRDRLVLVTTKGEIEKITEIEFKNKGIEDLTGIEKFTSLKYLNMSYNNISSIPDLSSLTQLEFLDLSYNNIKDVSNLSNCTSLQELYLKGFEIEDISPLNKLTNLTILDIGSQSLINDFSVLNNFKNLVVLNIRYTSINGLDFLEDLDNLNVLNISGINEVDLTPVLNKSSLTDLDLSDNHWITQETIKDINKLDKLSSLNISFTEVSDLEFLRDMNLKSLEINYLDIVDLEPISEMYSIEYLSMNGNNKIKTLDDIILLHNLKGLNVSGEITDASALDNGNFQINPWEEDSYIFFWTSLNLYYNDINESIKLPDVVKQMLDSNSIICAYSIPNLHNCYWDEYLETIKINENLEEYDWVGMSISSFDNENRYIYADVDIMKQEAEPEQFVNIEMTKAPKKTEYYEGEYFDKTGLVLVGTYSDDSKERFIDYKISPEGPLSADDTAVTISYVLNGETKEIEIPITIVHREIVDISIAVLPAKLEYIEGDMLDITGLEVYAIYDNGDVVEIRDYDILPNENLTLEDKEIKIIYNGFEKTIPITVNPRTIVGLDIQKGPDKTEYIEGEMFDKAGLMVVLVYNNEDREEVVDYTIKPDRPLTINDTEVIISYEENDISYETTINITVVPDPNQELTVEINGYEEIQGENETYIGKIQPNQTRADIKASITTNGEIIITDKDGNGTSDDTMKLATGDKVTITKGESKKEYVLIVKGDTNGNGTADFSDMLKMNKHRLGKVLLEGAFFKAGDIDENGIVNFSDMLKVNKFRLKKVEQL